MAVVCSCLKFVLLFRCELPLQCVETHPGLSSKRIINIGMYLDGFVVSTEYHVASRRRYANAAQSLLGGILEHLRVSNNRHNGEIVTTASLYDVPRLRLKLVFRPRFDSS